MVCMSMTSGYTSETPARAADPSQPTKTASRVVRTAWSTVTSTLGAARRSRVGATGASRSRLVRADTEGEARGETGAAAAVELMTCRIIVTCFSVKSRLECGHAQGLRPALPRRQDAGGRGRPLDAPRGPRPPRSHASLPGSPGLPPRHRAQHPVRPPQADGGAPPGDAPLLLRPSPAGGVRADGQGEGAGGGGGGAGRVGRPPRLQAGAARPRRLRARGSAGLLPRRHGRAGAREQHPAQPRLIRNSTTARLKASG